MLNIFRRADSVLRVNTITDINRFTRCLPWVHYAKPGMYIIVTKVTTRMIVPVKLACAATGTFI